MFKKFFTFLALVAVLTACDDSKNDSLVVITTPHGEMTLLLYEETPLHKANFLNLVESGAYDSTLFHRVMRNFMIQGGDMNIVKGKKKIDYAIPAEINKEFLHHKGALSAARMPDDVNPTFESSGSQFYIVQGTVYTNSEITVDEYKLSKAMGDLLQLPEYDSLLRAILALQRAGEMTAIRQISLLYADTVRAKLDADIDSNVSPEQIASYTTLGGSPHLDGTYTVFGKVIEGLEVIDKIAAVKVGERNKPLKDIAMGMKIVKKPKKEITEKYGYIYPTKK
jgi:peptidyl-prolyl cis-trans isomerase B (cyclophilin B)